MGLLALILSVNIKEWVKEADQLSQCGRIWELMRYQRRIHCIMLLMNIERTKIKLLPFPYHKVREGQACLTRKNYKPASTNCGVH